MKSFIFGAGFLLILVLLSWAGVLIYDASVNVEINPLAEQHMEKIKPQFQMDVIEEIDSRIDVLQVSPKIIRALERQPITPVEETE